VKKIILMTIVQINYVKIVALTKSVVFTINYVYVKKIILIKTAIINYVITVVKILKIVKNILLTVSVVD